MTAVSDMLPNGWPHNAKSLDRCRTVGANSSGFKCSTLELRNRWHCSPTANGVVVGVVEAVVVCEVVAVVEGELVIDDVGEVDRDVDGDVVAVVVAEVEADVVAVDVAVVDADVVAVVVLDVVAELVREHFSDY